MMGLCSFKNKKRFINQGDSNLKRWVAWLRANHEEGDTRAPPESMKEDEL